MIVLVLGDNQRVLSAGAYALIPEGAVTVEEDKLPKGDLYEYRFVDGEFIHDPLALPEQEVIPTTDERVDTLEGENILLKAQIQALSDRNDFLEDCLAEMACIIYA